MLTLREDADVNWAAPAAASDTVTAQPPATQPLLDLVRALGAELYINGTRVCPWCRENWGSRFCTCGPSEVMTTAPKDEDGQPLPAIYVDLRGGR